MKLKINEDENTYEKFKDKYILFDRGNETEFDNYEEAVEAYKSLNSKYKFLYQPDKRYFFVTLSSTGKYVGHDHLYHRTTKKCDAIFIANNINQIARFLNKVSWRYGSGYSKYRIYDGHYGSSPVCSDTDWSRFESGVRRAYLETTYLLDRDFGALDVNAPINVSSIPFAAYWFKI